MNITLRKADAIQKLINNAINSTHPQPTVTITRFNDPEKALTDANKKFLDDLTKKRSLFVALYEIRDMVGKVGATAGVPTILAQIACIDKTIGVMQPLASATEFFTTEIVLAAQQKDLLDDKTVERYTARRESVTASILSKDDVDGYIKEIEKFRRERLVLSDKLLEINVRSEIALSPEAEEILKEYGII